MGAQNKQGKGEFPGARLSEGSIEGIRSELDLEGELRILSCLFPSTMVLLFLSVFGMVRDRLKVEKVDLSSFTASIFEA